MPQSLTFATFLSPALFPTYEAITQYVGRAVGLPAHLRVGDAFTDFAAGRADIGFVCGLVYTHLARQMPAPVELLAAPILADPRYEMRPRYFSDVVVRADSPYTNLADLRGAVWAYNEKASHSGYNLVAHALLEEGHAPDYFGAWQATGSHARSIRRVLDGQADATAIDSHVLAVEQDTDPEVAAGLRVVATFGPSAIPPIVAAARLDATLKQRIRTALITLHHDKQYAQKLHAGAIASLAPVSDNDYDDIRVMYARVQASAFAAP